MLQIAVLRLWAGKNQSFAWQPVLVPGSNSVEGGLKWFVEPLMEKEDTLNHECQKLKLNFRIYYWSKLPFALLKNAGELVQRPWNNLMLLSTWSLRKKWKQWRLFPCLLLWEHRSPHQSLGMWGSGTPGSLRLIVTGGGDWLACLLDEVLTL